MTDTPTPTHRLMSEDTLELDSLPPRERARVEEVMAQIQTDIDKLIGEQFVGKQTSETIRENAEKIVAGWNADPEWLREFAQAMTGNPVESCRVVLDGFEGTNMLISYQIEFAKSGEHYDAWAARQEADVTSAIEAARSTLAAELPEDALEYAPEPDPED